jgi:hypothetical protein
MERVTGGRYTEDGAVGRSLSLAHESSQASGGRTNRPGCYTARIRLLQPVTQRAASQFMASRGTTACPPI